ncbi:probable protein phosphatase 2C 22 isoform X2 [Capsella rubella]|uniref:probable protein phosphatase 2C 22 isoform X2 n=1 Tax=Capsella rubella TaxID=81985 RepID=UPI000CD5104E|nr:probable protein phosphatase 2C 22 isoform X2 [Capsella rubella]
MEETRGIPDPENGSSSYGGKPPNPLSFSSSSAAVYRQSFDGERSLAPCNKRSLVRHPSLTKVSDISVENEFTLEKNNSEFVPAMRSGAWSDIGSRSSMEDAYLCLDNFMDSFGLQSSEAGPSAFYGVFDGHGGKHAADFACHHIPRYIVEDQEFPSEINKVMSSAFLQTDTAFSEACSLDGGLASGTTALAAILSGRLLVVANAGDCRAVLSRQGKAIELSRDHKPMSSKERRRIEASGGYIYDGYLNGQLNVARALGDFHIEGMKKKKDGSGSGPLIAEPELMTTKLTEEDEFLIIGCDGVWDVFMSQNAIDFARRRLQEHNDPLMCSKELVEEAIKRKSGDNVTAVVVCLQPQPPPNLVAPRLRVHRSFSAEGLKDLQSFLDGLGD